MQEGKYYEISQVKTVVGFTRFDIDAHGGREVKTNQIITYDNLLTLDQLKDIAENKIEPGQNIAVVVADGVIK